MQQKSFIVKSTIKKIKVKTDETETKYATFLQEEVFDGERGSRLLIHSDEPLELSPGDVLVLKKDVSQQKL